MLVNAPETVDDAPPSTRLVECPACGGEGRDIRAGTVYEPGCGHGHLGEVDCGPCLDCDGKGTAEIETAPVTLADIDACTHCGAPRDEAASRCTIPGAQHFPCDGEAP